MYTGIMPIDNGVVATKFRTCWFVGWLDAIADSDVRDTSSIVLRILMVRCMKMPFREVAFSPPVQRYRYGFLSRPRMAQFPWLLMKVTASVKVSRPL